MTQTANIVTAVTTTSLSCERIVIISTDKYVKFSQYQKFLNKFNVFTESEKKYIICSSDRWVINSVTTDHMTGNFNIFFSFWSHKSLFPVTIADGLSYNIVDSWTTKSNSSITLSFVLSLSKLAFNLIFVSNVNKDLNCCITFFPDHCVLQNLTTKQIIGKEIYQTVFTFLIFGRLDRLSALVLSFHLKYIFN